MRVKIIYASRYGSTKDVSALIAKALTEQGCEVYVCDVANAEFSGADFYLLGSGIYANRMLPEMETFIYENTDKLSCVRLGLFGVAMRTEAVERKGRMSGGVYVFDRYSLEPQIKKMLHGRMDFSILSENDREGLERFYNAIGLTEEQKADRRRFRDKVSHSECNIFAVEIISMLSVDT